MVNLSAGDRGYDHAHATSNTQFLAIVILMVAMFACGAGLVLGLAILTSIL